RLLLSFSGSGVQSKGTFLFGSIETLIKLVPGNSAGTVTTYYLSSTGKKHDEIDFEFLGNVSGQPYIIHTNIYTQGIGGREQQFYPWFDPTTDYHNYTIHWNPSAVVWYVDDIPIRVFRNYLSQGIEYPNAQAMGVYSSLWNADDWATRGGLDKINWNSAPFIARYRNFRTRACLWNGPVSINQCANYNWWYTWPQYRQLSYAKRGQMDWIRNKYMIYDYCKDYKRFNGQEANKDLIGMTLDKLVGNLRTYEMEVDGNKEQKTSKKILALKASDSDEEIELDKEQIAFITKNLSKFFKKKKGTGSKKRSNNNPNGYYKCGMTDHQIRECPLWEIEWRKERVENEQKARRKEKEEHSMIDAWGSDLIMMMMELMRQHLWH
ncbi:putative xyloglucan endotransglucosylase/hydrolase protein 26, partial [Capsicum annuum]